MCFYKLWFTVDPIPFTLRVVSRGVQCTGFKLTGFSVRLLAVWCTCLTQPVHQAFFVVVVVVVVGFFCVFF